MNCATCDRLKRLQTMANGALIANDPSNMRAVLQTIADTLPKVVESPVEPTPTLVMLAMLAYDEALGDDVPVLRNRTGAMRAAVGAVLRGGHNGV